jgi:hypothetical protein
MVAEFEADLIRLRTREGMKVAKAKGRLRGKQPKLSPIQEAHLVKLYRAGEHTIGDLEELFAVTQSTVYRAIQRDQRRCQTLTTTGTATPSMLAVLSAQRADARQLAEDAQARGWNDEADRHLALVERLEAIIAKTNAARPTRPRRHRRTTPSTAREPR